MVIINFKIWFNDLKEKVKRDVDVWQYSKNI